jgi:hypothetical protein
MWSVFDKECANLVIIVYHYKPTTQNVPSMVLKSWFNAYYVLYWIEDSVYLFIMVYIAVIGVGFAPHVISLIA